MQNGEIRRCSKAQSTLFNLFSFAKIFTVIILGCFSPLLHAQKMSREWPINNSYSISHSSVHPSLEWDCVHLSILMDLVVCNSIKVVLLLLPPPSPFISLMSVHVVPSSTCHACRRSPRKLLRLVSCQSFSFNTRINSISRITKHPSVDGRLHGSINPSIQVPSSSPPPPPPLSIRSLAKKPFP